MANTALVEAAARQHHRATRTVRDRIVALVAASWTALGTYRDADIERFVAAVVPVVAGGQRQVAALTASYLSTVAAATLEQPPRAVGVKPEHVTGAAVRNGTDPAQVYRRAGITVWTDLADGKAPDVAIRRGGQRATNAAVTDLQLARTHTARWILSDDPNAAGYRRTLTGSRSCGLCVVASTQRYRRGDLMPIHPGCSCGIEPIYGRDPGRVLEPELLAETHAAIRDTFGVSDAGARDPIDYRDLLQVRRHGELGPVLTVRDHSFTGPDDI